MTDQTEPGEATGEPTASDGPSKTGGPDGTGGPEGTEGNVGTRGTAGLPAPVGPYTPSVRVGGWLICSGQVGGRDGILARGLSAQVSQSLANVETLVRAEGGTLANVVKTTVFLTDMADYPAMNEAYIAAFGDHRPARSAIAVAGLPLGALVEIEAWAWIGI